MVITKTVFLLACVLSLGEGEKEKAPYKKYGAFCYKRMDNDKSAYKKFLRAFKMEYIFAHGKYVRKNRRRHTFFVLPCARAKLNA